MSSIAINSITLNTNSNSFGRLSTESVSRLTPAALGQVCLRAVTDWWSENTVARPSFSDRFARDQRAALLADPLRRQFGQVRGASASVAL